MRLTIGSTLSTPYMQFQCAWLLTIFTIIRGFYLHISYPCTDLSWP